MARILDVLNKAADKPIPSREHRAIPTNRTESKINHEDDENADVPFIEIGAPSGRVMSKSLRDLATIPSIIPMPRPTLSVAASKPDLPAAATAPAYFHVSFQRLPGPHGQFASAERRFAHELVAFHAPDHAVSEQYRTLAREMELDLGEEQRRALFFSSAVPAAGTTSVMLNLAITLARRAGTQVVVVDANTVRPAIADRLGVAKSPGLGDILAGAVPLAWATQETGLPNLRALAYGQHSGAPALESWRALSEQLRQRFDWVLIDSAEWNGQSEQAALAASCSGAYFVLRHADLASERVSGLLEDVSRRGVRLRGYVLAHGEPSS